MQFALMEKKTVTSNKYEIFVESHEKNKMGYSTPDIIIITTTTTTIIIIMMQECETVEAIDMQMARHWCDKRQATETNLEDVHNLEQRNVGGKYVGITGGRKETAQMTLLQVNPNWWKHQQTCLILILDAGMGQF